MTDKALKNLAASIRVRLLNYAREHGDDYQRILTRYAIERLLFRLSQTEAVEHYILKGAMLFVAWPEHPFRPTRDLDLLGHGDPDPDVISELFTRICQVEAPDDGIVFDAATLKVEPVRETDKYQGIRLSLKGYLAKVLIPVQVDIGFGDHIFPPAKRQTFPNLLPDLPTANIQMYPPETVIAEKFEAMIRFGKINGRIKDFYDIWIIIRMFEFDLPDLVKAVGGTFQRRKTDIPTETPVGLTETFADIAEKSGLWSGFLRRSPPTLQPPPFVDLLQELRRFFYPVIESLALPKVTEARWDPNRKAWLER